MYKNSSNISRDSIVTSYSPESGKVFDFADAFDKKHKLGKYCEPVETIFCNMQPYKKFDFNEYYDIVHEFGKYEKDIKPPRNIDISKFVKFNSKPIMEDDEHDSSYDMLTAFK